MIDLNLGEKFTLSSNVEVKVVQKSDTNGYLSYRLGVYVNNSWLVTTDWVSKETLGSILGPRKVLELQLRSIQDNIKTTQKAYEAVLKDQKLVEEKILEDLKWTK